MIDIKPEMILQSLNGALRNRNLYPPGHPAIAAMTKKSFNMLNEYLKGKDSALFGILNETLVFDEFPIMRRPQTIRFHFSPRGNPIDRIVFGSKEARPLGVVLFPGGT